MCQMAGIYTAQYSAVRKAAEDWRRRTGRKLPKRTLLLQQSMTLCLLFSCRGRRRRPYCRRPSSFSQCYQPQPPRASSSSIRRLSITKIVVVVTISALGRGAQHSKPRGAATSPTRASSAAPSPPPRLPPLAEPPGVWTRPSSRAAVLPPPMVPSPEVRPNTPALHTSKS